MGPNRPTSIYLSGAAQPRSRIQVEITPEPPPPVHTGLLFDSEGAWTMESEGEDGYRLCFRSLGGAGAEGCVRSNADTSAVTIHLSLRRARPHTEDEGRHKLQVVSDPVGYPLDQILLMNHLASRSGVIVHAAGLDLQGRGLVFAGASRAGKSTLSRLLARAGLADDLLSDDRIILREAADADAEAGRGAVADETSAVEGDPRRDSPAFLAYGTPWPGDARIARNASAPLSALLFLVKASSDRIVPIEPGEALRRLMPVISCPWYDEFRFPDVLDTCGRVVEDVPSYILESRGSPEVVELLLEHPWDERR